VQRETHPLVPDDELDALLAEAQAAQPPTATIIMTVPNELMAPINTRMPIILQPGDEARWLDPTIIEPEQLQTCLEPYAAAEMAASAISALVNSHVNDRAEILAPAPVTQPALL
jgi:putative SOS response-associated peptidase YedK